MKNESRFRISHVFLFLFLLGGAAFFAYEIVSMIDMIRYFHWAYALYYVVLIPLFVFFLYAAFGLVKSDIKNIKDGKSTSLYENENK